MRIDAHPDEMMVVYPTDRSEEQQLLVDEGNLAELPDSLDHEATVSGKYIGVPGETTVYEVVVDSEWASPKVPSTWLLSVADQGWTVVNVYVGHVVYGGRFRMRLGQLPVVGQLFGEEYLKVRVQRSEEYEEETTQAQPIVHTE